MKLWAIAIIAGITSCATPTRHEVQQSEREDLRAEIQDEITMGREMAAKLLGHLGPYTQDPKALEYVNLVGASLVQKVGRPELNYRFGIVNSQEINAFATPGGYVFVTQGLLNAVRDESELAGVLGHEIAHINEKHMYREISPKRSVTASETITRVMSRGSSDLGKSITQLVNKGLKMLLEDGMGLEKERAADGAGAVYVGAVGYNPYAIVRFLRRISTVNDARIPKSAPSFTERIVALEKSLKENGLEDRARADTQVLDHRFGNYLAHASPKNGT